MLKTLPEIDLSRRNRNNREQKSVKAQNIRRLASLERSKADVMDEIIQDAQTRESQWVVLLDGALHLWELVGQHLKGVGYVGIIRHYPCC